MTRYMLLTALAAMLLAGCGGKNPPENNAEWHTHLGRNYAAQGRYELAKEHLLMALAANDDPEKRDAIVHELKSVDTFILTKR